RETYRPDAPAPVEQEPRPGPVVGQREIGGPPTVGVTTRTLGRVWVRAGTELREGPDRSSAVVERVPHIRTMTLIERRGEWRRASGGGLAGASRRGWVRQADLAEPSADELWQPEPVLPLPAAAPSAEVLAEARRTMRENGREVPCGPFSLITDVVGSVIEICPRLAGQLDRLYSARTGLEPVGEPAEAILLFASHGAYMIFRSRVSPEIRRHAFAAPARGFVAAADGGRPVERVRATLVHELVHLLNRRFLGPALPSWLDEGLAEELAMSRIGADGTLTPDSLGSWQEAPDHVLLFGGGQVALGGLRASMRSGDLPTLATLVRLDRAAFQAEERLESHYALSAFWVRYLLSGESPARGEGFRSFLAAVAEGRPLDEELLLASLGADWPELETGFRRWLDSDASAAATG
ncbi:MAG: hypothetical protein ACE5EG_10635, partial [Thermoanaerobaculia bacterium]